MLSTGLHLASESTVRGGADLDRQNRAFRARPSPWGRWELEPIALRPSGREQTYELCPQRRQSEQVKAEFNRQPRIGHLETPRAPPLCSVGKS
jgi:hypothetical protein